jgi:hypothetical protein
MKQLFGLDTSRSTPETAVGAASAGVGLVYLAFLSPLIYSADGNSMLAVAESLVTKRNFTVAASVGHLGRGGNYYSIWYPLESILAVPFVALGNAIAHVTHLPSHFVAGVFTSLLSILLCTGSVYLTGMLALRLGASIKGAILGALAFGLGTITPVYARDFFADPPLTLMTAATLFFAMGEGAYQSAIAAAAAGLAVLCKPSGIILGPLVSAYKLFKTRSLRQALVPLVGTAVGSLLFLLYNDLRFGEFTNFGREGAAGLDGFTIRHFFEAAAAMLISPGRGVVWYCPPILGLLGLRRTKLAHAEVLLILGVGGAYWLLYSCWQDWAGGWAWGPRFLLAILPGLLALTGLLSERRLRIMPVLILLGFVVSAPNLVCFFERYQTEDLANRVSPAQEMWSPSKSPLIGIWRVAYHEIRDARATDVRSIVHNAGKSDNRPEDWRAFRIVAVWWWLLPAFGIPRFVGAAVALLLLGFGATLIRYSLRCIAVLS